jgi:hypothetical protein
MARSTGPYGPPGTRAPLRRPADDPFAPPAPAQPNGQWPTQQAYPDQGQQQGQGYHFPPEPEPSFGYGQQHAQPHAQQWGQQGDPRGYDLGSYMPQGAQPYPAPEPAPFHQTHHGAYGAQQAYAQHDAYDDDYVDEEDGPRRGRRWLLIAAALVGAIGVGGALAYTYKAVIAPNGGRVPWVKAGDPNVKVKPEARAGKEAGDKKMLTRLSDEAQQKAPPAADAQDDKAGEDGPKRVKTIAIPVGGSPPPAAAPPPVVPGIMLDNVGPPRAQPVPNQPAPKVVAVPPPPPLPQVEKDEEPEPPPAKRVHVPAVAAKPPPPPPRAREPPAVVPTGAGYVAVLSSQKSRMDALKAFADMQQKYGDVLANKTPDVQQADLSARGLGIMYRLVVGPPGSRDAASGVCSQLKSAGYVGCWVTEY